MHSKTATLLVVALTGQLVATVALALALASLIDEAIPSRDTDQVIRVVLALLAVLAICTLAALVQAHLLAKLSSEVVFDLQRRLLNHILRLPAQLLDRKRSGDLLARFSSDLAPVAEAVGVGGPRLVMYSIVVSGCLAAIAWID
jgi:ABC-type multidrug transport system fused ATPase/permease subunit